MGVISAALRHMFRANMDPADIVAAIEEMEAAQTPARTARQDRNARYYAKKASEKRLKASETSYSDESVLNQTPSREPTRGVDNLQTKNLSGQKKQDSLGASAPERDFFADFWLAYPSREGPNPKKPARERFIRLVAKGVDPEAIIAAAHQLAAEHPTPTRFVPQAVTWLNQERFADSEPVKTGDEFCPEEWANTRFLVLRYRQENQTDPPRAVQGGKAGYLIPAEWVALSKMRQTANA